MASDRVRAQNRKVFYAVTYFLLVIAVMAGSAFAYNIPTSRVLTNASYQSTPWYGYAGTNNTIPSAGAAVNCVTNYGVPTDGVTNARSAIQNCVNGISGGQVAYLPAGTYIIGSTITMPSNKVLRGAGMGVTILKASGFSGTFTGIVDFQGTSGSHFGTGINIASGYTKGSKSITLSSSHTYSVGDIIIVDQLNDTLGTYGLVVNPAGTSGTCSEAEKCGRDKGTRMLGETNKITSINGLTLGLEVPLAWTFQSALTPQVSKLEKVVKNAGLESLTLDMNNISGTTGLTVYDASDSWVYQVEVKNTIYTVAHLHMGYRNTIKGCIFGPENATGGNNQGYGLLLTGAMGHTLIEDNIFIDMHSCIMHGGASTGNVIAYNYFVAKTQSGTWSAAIRPHDGHPLMNLYEGNIGVGTVIFDNDWGSMSHFTLFRNRFGLTAPLSGKSSGHLIYTMQRATYQNYIGNVLGIGSETVYEYVAADKADYGNSSIFKTGYSSEGDNTASGNDATVFSTMLRHMNYDYKTATTKACGDSGEPGCQGGDKDSSISNSLYLFAKPSWWGGQPWPPIGPDVTGYVASIPAKDRFDGAPPPVSHTVTPSAGPNGSISPNTPRTVNDGTTATFTVTPNAGYTASVGGTCGGTLTGSTYITNSVTSNCTVVASFALIPGGTQTRPGPVPDPVNVTSP